MAAELRDREVAVATSADGTTIEFDVVGDGPPVIVVGGALSLRGVFANLLDALSGSFTTVAYDRRGRGGSGDTAPYAVEREFEDLKAVIDAVGGGAFVYGHSSGGVLALRANAAGVGIERLCCYEPPLFDQGAPATAIVARTQQAIAEGRLDDVVASFFNETGAPAEVLERTRNSPQWAGLIATAPTLLYDFQVSGDDPSGPALDFAAVTASLLVLQGSLAGPMIRERAAYLLDHLPTARHEVVEGQRHNVSSAALAPYLLDFFAAG